MSGSVKAFKSLSLRRSKITNDLFHKLNISTFLQRIRTNFDLMAGGLAQDFPSQSWKTMIAMSFPMWRFRSTFNE